MRADGDPALGGGLGRELEGVTGSKNLTIPPPLSEPFSFSP